MVNNGCALILLPFSNDVTLFFFSIPKLQQNIVGKHVVESADISSCLNHRMFGISQYLCVLHYYFWHIANILYASDFMVNVIAKLNED